MRFTNRGIASIPRGRGVGRWTTVYIIRREAPKCTKSPFLVWDTTGRFDFSEPARSTSLVNRGDPRPRSNRCTKRRNQNQIRSGIRRLIGHGWMKQVEFDLGRSAEINTTIETRDLMPLRPSFPTYPRNVSLYLIYVIRNRCYRKKELIVRSCRFETLVLL